ncbi:hypothetical protein CEXT_69771 [Caerostris extrusa]|uniref:Uncharacterized protein n=1 Tax=Caerostris extrusa TaxID=172846 RepID=A0AAV4NY77_CAEEX|nr:hypothetical protein CEXT_69771 [Caerostris extrusa]
MDNGTANCNNEYCVSDEDYLAMIHDYIIHALRMDAHQFACCGLRGWTCWKCFSMRLCVQEPHHAHCDQLLHRESCSGRFLGYFGLPSTDSSLGRDGNLVLWKNHMQTGTLFAGKFKKESARVRKKKLQSVSWNCKRFQKFNFHEEMQFCFLERHW